MDEVEGIGKKIDKLIKLVCYLIGEAGVPDISSEDLKSRFEFYVKEGKKLLDMLE